MIKLLQIKETMKQLEFKFGYKTLYINIDDWKAQKDFRKEKEGF